MDELIKFSELYYKDKDIMHNMWHINLVKKQVDKIIKLGNYKVNYDNLLCAIYFHGFIYSNEKEIREFLIDHNYSDKQIEEIIKIAWESQRSEVPETIEGKILHDAHVLEGGKTYLVVKTLITGSLRNQDLSQTLDFMKNNVLDKNKCYLKETIPLCEEMNKYTNDFYNEIIKEVN